MAAFSGPLVGVVAARCAASPRRAQGRAWAPRRACRLVHVSLRVQWRVRLSHAVPAGAVGMDAFLTGASGAHQLAAKTKRAARSCRAGSARAGEQAERTQRRTASPPRAGGRFGYVDAWDAGGAAAARDPARSMRNARALGNGLLVRPGTRCARARSGTPPGLGRPSLPGFL